MAPRKKIDATSERKEVAATPVGAAANTLAQSDTAPTGVSRPPLALLKSDTREKLLYKIACTGTPLGSDFFDQFTDMQEILQLALNISVRLMTVAICDSALAPTQRIACMRLVAALNGKQLPGTEEEPATKPAPPFSIPTGAADDVQRSLDKFKELSKAS